MVNYLNISKWLKIFYDPVLLIVNLRTFTKIYILCIEKITKYKQIFYSITENTNNADNFKNT